MKMLIVEDEFVSRRILMDILSDYGICHVAADGKEAVDAFEMAWEEGKPYDLLCLDIKMPRMDGHEVLASIRSIEEQRGVLAASGVKIIMTTALQDSKNLLGAFRSQCDSYLVKPIDKDELLNAIKSFGLIE